MAAKILQMKPNNVQRLQIAVSWASIVLLDAKSRRAAIAESCMEGPMSDKMAQAVFAARDNVLAAENKWESAVNALMDEMYGEMER